MVPSVEAVSFFEAVGAVVVGNLAFAVTGVLLVAGVRAFRLWRG